MPRTHRVHALPALLITLLTVAPATEAAGRWKTDPDHCAKDADCAVVGPIGCCSGCGGWSPPYRAVRADHWARQVEQNRRRCARKSVVCPVYSCVKPPDCRFAPFARCVQGRCAAEVRLEGQCGTGDATARCGAQPPWAGGDACALYHLSRWVHCHCLARGGKDCDQHRATACWSDARCRPAPPPPRGAPPYPTCPVRR